MRTELTHITIWNSRLAGSKRPLTGISWQPFVQNVSPENMSNNGMEYSLLFKREQWATWRKKKNCLLLTDLTWHITSSSGTAAPQLHITYPLTYMTTPFGHPKAMSKTELLTFPALPPHMFQPQSSPYNSIQPDGAQVKNLKTILDSCFSLISPPIHQSIPLARP